MGVGTDEEREWEGGAGIYAPRSYCARSEPVVSESCSLKSREVSIHIGEPLFFLLVLQYICG